MAAENIVHKLTESLSWPYHGHWGEWALLAIAVASLVLLVVAARAQARSQD